MKTQKEKDRLLSNTKYVISRIIRLERGLLSFTIIALLTSSLLLFTAPYILKVVIDGLDKPIIDEKELFIKIIWISASLAVIAIINFFTKNAAWWRIIRLRTKMIIEKNEKVLLMDYQTLELPKMQDMIEKATAAVDNNWDGFEGLYNYGKEFLVAFLAVIIASSIVFFVNPYMIIITIFLALAKYFARNKVHKIDKKIFWDSIPLYRRKLQYVRNVSRNPEIAKDLRIFGMREYIEREQEGAQNTIHGKLRKSKKLHFKLEVFFQIIALVQEFLFYGILIHAVLYNNMEIGTFTFMLASVRTLSRQLSVMFSNYSDVQNCSRQVNDLIAFMEFEKETDEKEYLPLPNEKSFQLEFKNVCFRYFNQKNYTLENISFTLNKNEKLAIVGYNGAGKTTLIKLMCGLYHPESGEILLNGVNINNYKRDDYFRLFAPAFQEVYSYCFNIGENVAMQSSNDVDYEKALEALLLAGLETKLNALPKKIKTMIGKWLYDDGIEFSGGELQKLTLARAIYKNSPFIILDEPTSALDAIAEYNMYLNFNKIVDKSSAIYISHRLSSTRFCDRIILMKDGKIAEIGTHKELMQKGGEYKNLFDIQARYYRDEAI